MLAKRTLIIYEYPHEIPYCDTDKAYRVLAWGESGIAEVAILRHGIFFSEVTRERMHIKHWADLPKLEDIK